MAQEKKESAQQYHAVSQQLTATNERLDRIEQQIATLADALGAASGHTVSAQINQLVQQQISPLQSELFKLKSLTSLVARNQIRPAKPVIRVIFLVHGIEFWDSLHNIYALMLAHERFEPIVVSIKRDSLANGQYSHEEANFNGLEELGINALRFNSDNDMNDLEMLKVMNPDIIFRQSPWELNYQPAFKFHEINFAKLCYVSYGVTTIPFTKEELNLYFTRSCWRAYCESESQRKMWADFFMPESLKLSGPTKLDRIVDTQNKREWPLPASEDTIRVIWAPHHSINEENWLCYSTFMDNYRQFLQLAKECPELQIVLKPHPLLFAKIVRWGLISDTDLMAYLREFTALPNAALVTGGNYISMFWASDVLISDGISFFGEYMVTGKPIIWTQNPRYRPMNEIGQLIITGMYKALDFNAVVTHIEQLFVNKKDPLKARRQDITKQLMPNAMRSAQFIIDDILSSLDKERGVPQD